MNTGSDTDSSLRHASSRSSRAIKTGYQRFERPVYDHDAKYAPCRAGCPAGHDIAWATHVASRGRLDLALQAFKEDSPFPAITGRVCYHPCEHHCNRADLDQPIAINALERAFAEYGNGHPIELAPRMHEESIGVVGGGPAGLACAYHLVRLGYPVTLYDANDRPGGVLTYGIPAYRLPREVVGAEVSGLHALGIAFRCGVRVGVDISFEEVRQAHHAVFLAPGLARPRPLSVPTPKDPRIQSGLGFLRAVSTGTAQPLCGHVLVVGGGDVAIDAARSALRLGADQVTICCAESRAEMPAHPEEVSAARHEGIEILDAVVPVDLDVRAAGMHLGISQVAQIRRAEDGSWSFELKPGSRRALSACHLIYAVGQDADLSFLPAPLSQKRRLRVDAWGRTSLPGVFAGGDITGSYNVVNAIGSAKRAAIGIDALLRGRSLEGVDEVIRVGSRGALSMRAYHAVRRGEPDAPKSHGVRIHDVNLDYFSPAERTLTHEIDAASRSTSFVEVAQPLSLPEVQAESARCFGCGTCTMCGVCFIFCPDSSVVQLEDWGFSIDLDHCKGCGVCVQECPRDAMSMVPEWEVAREFRAR